jgi:hypothetical protein
VLESGVVYEGRSCLIALLHRLGMEHRKAKVIMAGAVGLPHPALHPVTLPASRSDRTIMRLDDPALHPQQMLCRVQGFQSFGTDFSAWVSRYWHVYCHNFRVIDPQIFGFSRDPYIS